MEQEYYAFISYKREDEKWAKWLQDKLEHYKFPTNLNGRSDLPKNIRPTFRDVTDLKPGLLAEEIDAALRNSQWLIVVCSPRSAKSPWVCKEAQTFIDLGRADHIIPFVIEGNPFSEDTSTECYPEALLNLTGSKELLAANINEMGRDAAVIKIVARMFGLRFDTLWQRHERERRRRRNWIIAAVALFVLAVLSVAAYIWQQNKLITQSKAELQTAYNNLTVANAKTQQERDRANQERKSAELQKERAELAEDSVRVQYGIIQQTLNNLRRTTDAKSQAQSRAAAGAAIKMIENRDSYTARKIAMEAYILCPTPEAERTLRKACESDARILKGHSKPVNYSSYNSQSTKIISTSIDSTIKIWDVSSGKCLKTLKGHSAEVNCAIFSPNDNIIASASNDKTIRIWSSITGECLDTFIGHEGAVKGLSFNYSGDYLASASYDNTIRIWSIKEKKCIDTLVGHSGKVSDVCFFPKDNRIASSSWDKSIKIWENGECIQTLWGSTSAITKLIVNKNNYIISASAKKIALWDIKQNKCIDSIESRNLFPFISQSKNGENILFTSDAIIHILELANGKFNIVNTLYGFQGEIKSAFFNNHNEKIVISLDNHTIQLIDCSGSHFKEKRNYLSKTINSLTKCPLIAYSMDEKEIISIDAVGTLRKYCISNGKCIDSIPRNINVADNNTLIINKKGDKYYVLSDLSIKEYDYKSFRCTDSIIRDFGKWSAITSDGRLFAQREHKKISQRKFSHKNIFVIDRKSKKIIHLLEGHNGDVLNAIFSHDGRILASTSQDKTLRIWDIEKGICTKTIPLSSNSYKIAIDHNSKLIATSVNQIYEFNNINIYNIQTGELLQSLKGHTGGIESICFSSNSKYIVSASDDKTIKVWDVATGFCIQTLYGHTQEIRQAFFNSNDTQIISSSWDGTIKIWDFPPIEKLIEETKKRFKDNPLTPEERRQYYLE